MPSTSIARLGTGPQGKNEAIHVASQYFISKPVSARPVEEQRAHSRTFIVTLENSTEAIIKLRDTEIDLSRVALAHSILGDIAPEVHSGKVRKANFAYVGQLVPGTPWDIAKTSYKDIVTISADLARILTKCSLGINSAGVVDHYIKSRLETILQKDTLLECAPARECVAALLEPARISELTLLPLSLCHPDLGTKNIILDDENKIVSIVN
ncbi:uncharacterized protein ARMOST_09888 [Armillaria ostoyae]|uniref:Aminoglycoside phosphotransferase domain-containing protein n=1 Tax=Armillaria ostoyae TaxID=47428 RepID=A0A284RCS3_ARMOS|nr:uncharacterized protein ARMOST_09888 [Armillaria ostoyae]